MDAASCHEPSLSAGYRRILEHCVAVGRVSEDPAATARARLETTLGPELADRLVDALAGGGRRYLVR